MTPESSNSNIRLLLFDIDGTLIRTAGAGRRALEAAFEKIYGIPNGFEGIPMMGRTDPLIVKDALDRADLSWEEGQIEQFKESYYDCLRQEIEKPHSDKRLCEGVMPLLQHLQTDSSIVLGLLTGNWQVSALIKLRHFGIADFFKLGAFADDSANRELLVPVALDRCSDLTGTKPPASNVYVIGDTPLDVACARPHGVRTVAVATGFHSMEELEAVSPEYVFPHFADTDSVLAMFNNI